MPLLIRQRSLFTAQPSAVTYHVVRTYPSGTRVCVSTVCGTYHDGMRPFSSRVRVQAGSPKAWVADSENCMQCDLKFSVARRRHHCRMCVLAKSRVRSATSH